MSEDWLSGITPRFRLAFQGAMNRRGFVCLTWRMSEATGKFLRPERGTDVPVLVVASPIVSHDFESIVLDFHDAVDMMAEKAARDYDRMLSEGRSTGIAA